MEKKTTCEQQRALLLTLREAVTSQDKPEWVEWIETELARLDTEAAEGAP